MPQRALFKTKPWVFVTADEMQLRQDAAVEDPLDILNDLALPDQTTSAAAVVSPTKRKRNESAPVETSPNKRVKSSRLQDASRRPATTSPTPASKKLKRPKKDHRRHMTNIYPAVKPGGDIWDPEGDTPEKPQAKTAKKGKAHKSKKMMSQRQRASAVDASSPVSEGARASGKPRGRPKKKGTGTKPGKKTADTTTGIAPQSSEAVEIVLSTVPPISETADRGAKKGSTGNGSQHESDGHEDDVPEQEDVDSMREASPGQEEDSEDTESQGSVEDGESGLDGKGETVEEQMDLLGQEREWKKMVEYARAVDKTRLKTTTIKALVSDIREAKQLYKHLLSHGGIDPTAVAETTDQLAKRLRDIEDRIQDIAEENEPNNRRDMIREIYSRAIPAMVLLLESALSLRTTEGHGLHGYAALKEIVRLQDMVVMLCMKAIAWKIKPNTGLPIMKPTQKVIHPYVRDMRKQFGAELKELSIKEKRKQNRLITAQKEKAAEQRQAEMQVHRPTQMTEDQYRRHTQEERQRYLNSIKGGIPIVRKPQSLNVPPVKRTSTQEWTEEALQALLRELYNTRALSSERRYLAALNNEFFQNMLPEHIREKAVELKPDLMEITSSAPWDQGLLMSMWSHTIQSSKPKAPTASNARSAETNGPATTNDKPSVDVAQEEDMSQEFDTDGFSKTSRVRPSKKPLTVAKAPVLGRTTSSRAESQPMTPKENARPTLEKRASRPPPSQTARGGTPIQAPRAGTPTKPATTAAKARAAVLSSRARTPIQAATKSRAETPSSGRPAVRNSKAGGTSKGHVGTARTEDKLVSPAPEDEKTRNLNDEKGAESVSEAASHADPVEVESPLDQEMSTTHIATVNGEHDSPGDEEARSPKGHNGHNIGDTEERTESPNQQAEEKPSHEIVRKDKIIKSLRNELQESKSAYERKIEELDSTAAAQVESLRSELDSVRSTLVDLDDTHRSTLEKHDSLLRSRDKIIQNLSQEVENARSSLEADQQRSSPAPEDHGQELHTVEEQKGVVKHNEVLQSKDQEIQSLSETVQDLRKQLDAADTAKAKEIYDELLRSKDKEIASVSGVVKNLKGELQAVDKPVENKNHAHLMKSKDEKIKSLSETVKGLQEKLEANDKAKEQEVNHSVLSLRGEFQELQNKHKRKIEDQEASAKARVETLQSEYDELLRSRDQEIKDVAGMAQELQKEIETAREDQKQQLEDARSRHEQQSQQAKAAHEKELSEAMTQHEQDISVLQVAHNDVDSKHASEIQERARKHKHDLDAARSEQQAADTNHQQELREVRRKHEKSLESIRTEVEDGFREKISRLERDLEDVSTKQSHDIEQIQTKHREEIERHVRNHEQASKDVALQHEQELEEASTKYQKELADVERLRGEGSEEISQKHEKQLEAISEKYRQELDEATRKHNDLVSRHEQQLQELKASCEEIRSQADTYKTELDETREKYESLEHEKHIQEEKLLELKSTHDQESYIAATEHQKDIDETHTKNNELTELLEKQKQDHQEKINALDLDLQHALSTSQTAAAELVSLNATVEELKLSQSNVEEEAKNAHQNELSDIHSRHEHDLGRMLAESEAAAAEIVSLKETLENSDALRSQADNDAALEQQQRFRDLALEHDQVIARLRSDHDATFAEMAAAQAGLQNINQKAREELAILDETLKEAETARNEARVEMTLLRDQLEVASQEKQQYIAQIKTLHSDIEDLQTKLSDSGRDIHQQQEEATVEVALQKSKLELANRENAQFKETITKLQSDLEALRTELTESIEDLNREKTEVAVEVALLNDKLELAELQKQSASEDMSLSQNEANVEIALLKDKLELADLQSQDNRKTIVALQERLPELQAKPVDTSPFVHHQLREELGMLARHHAANLEDIEALKASVLAERELREEEWRKRVQSRAHLDKQMQGIAAELNGITGVH